MIARPVLAVCALAFGIVLAGRLDVARDIARAERIGTADTDRAQRLFRDAARRTSDTAPLIREAQLLLFARRPGEALAAARRAAREEPENARAWLVVAQAAARADPQLERTARTRLDELVGP